MFCPPLPSNSSLPSDRPPGRPADGVDGTLWWFKAGSSFSGNLGVAYAGTLEFSIGSFSGTFAEGSSGHRFLYPFLRRCLSRNTEETSQATDYALKLRRMWECDCFCIMSAKR